MRMLKTVIAFALAAAPAVALGALKEGAKAPDFTTTGAFAGKEFHLHLKDQLRHGPIVLYFFPKSFTTGCTFEAHAFSDAAPDFKKLGAQVIGMSADDQPTLARFSTEECRNAFPVATASPATIQAYDVKLGSTPLTSRTSYVIAPDGKILYAYSDMDYKNHVANTMAAVKAWKAQHPHG
ncbi:MAG TPA: peroxiredoxin [Allosphingosinicella sp.]|jgi:peroxiredoxin|nr:peroxiredoxin [Allosphingosinicella sp.]